MSQGSPAPSRPNSQRPPCPTHGLATGPDGRCTLCKRAEIGSYRPPEPENASRASRVTTGLIGVAALASVAVALSVALGWIPLGGSSPAVATAERDKMIAESSQRMPRGYGPAQQPVELGQQAVELAQAVPRPDLPAQPLAAAATPASDGLAIAEQTKQKLAEQAERDRKRSESIKADMEARALKRARGNVSIVMYSTKWCGVCTEARDYMSEHGIQFVDHDVDASASARAIYERLNPRKSIPTIDVDGEVMVGFSGESLDEMIDDAARKRVR
jgi:glutaredoxin